jgi:hypothetical protein
LAGFGWSFIVVLRGCVFAHGSASRQTGRLSAGRGKVFRMWAPGVAHRCPGRLGRAPTIWRTIDSNFIHPRIFLSRDKGKVGFVAPAVAVNGPGRAQFEPGGSWQRRHRREAARQPCGGGLRHLPRWCPVVRRRGDISCSCRKLPRRVSARTTKRIPKSFPICTCPPRRGASTLLS